MPLPTFASCWHQAGGPAPQKGLAIPAAVVPVAQPRILAGGSGAPRSAAEIHLVTREEALSPGPNSPPGGVQPLTYQTKSQPISAETT